jgi:Protein of unknown function (DUF2950)
MSMHAHVPALRRDAPLLLPLLLAGLCACGGEPAGGASAMPAQASFASPEAAVRALGDIAGTGDVDGMTRLFGADGVDLLRSGDDAADREDGLHVRELIAEKVAFESQADGSQIALLGHDAWPMPVPLVPDAGRWRFDAAAGREELENRRVGRNELLTLAALHAYVDAQREYASEGHDGLPPCYALHVLSSPGKHDGLYWPTADGEPESPLGPQVADAAVGREQGDQQPFHGYLFRVLPCRGAQAPGGAKNYVDAQGLMTGGFAALAWPVKYGSSGVMTFVIDDRGIAYQKDLGDETESVAKQIECFEVDESWEPTAD